MSGRQQELSQEELEIHHVLSPSASSTVSVSPGQRPPVENQFNLPNKPPVQLCNPNNDHSYSNVKENSDKSKENLDQFKSMFKEMKTFITKIDDSGVLKNHILEECFGSSGPEEEEQDGDEEYDTDEENEMEDDLPMNNPTSKQVSFFGVDVNEPKSSEVELPYGTKGRAPFEDGAPDNSSVAHPVVDNNNNSMSDKNKNPTLNVPFSTANSAAPDDAIAPVRAPIDNSSVPVKPTVSSSIAAAPGSSANPNPALTLPDPSLPLPSSRPTKNWDPDHSVLQWASKTLETCEWAKEDREFFVTKFSTDPDYDHLFSAVPNPPELLAAIKSPELVDKDFLFKRAETEDFLFSANEDLACGFRPLLEVLSSLKDKGMNDTRTQLAYVFQSMSSAICKISRSRRELGRRFVPLDSAPALFKNKPSPQCLFGYSSIESAIEKAVESKKVNKDLVFIPKKRKAYNYSSYGSRLLGKIYKGRSQRPYSNNYYNNYNNNKQFDRRKFFQEKQDSRRKPRRGGRRGWYQNQQNQNQYKKNPRYYK